MQLEHVEPAARVRLISARLQVQPQIFTVATTRSLHRNCAYRSLPRATISTRPTPRPMRSLARTAAAAIHCSRPGATSAICTVVMSVDCTSIFAEDLAGKLVCTISASASEYLTALLSGSSKLANKRCRLARPVVCRKRVPERLSQMNAQGHLQENVDDNNNIGPRKDRHLTVSSTYRSRKIDVESVQFT